jgi:hypothetical protein
MTRKKLMVLSVAAACATPMIAQANWEVITPSSVDESAPQLTVSRSHLGTTPTPATTLTQVQTGPAPAGTGAAYRAEESALSAADLRSRQARARRASLPNPQTPWSPNESGSNHYSQDMHAYRQHVASLEQARTVAAASYAPLIVIAEAPPPAPETPVASADAAATHAANTAAPAPRTDIPPANTPVANAEASAEADRLLRNPDAPQDRPRETVATMSPMLVDTRQPGTSDLRIETTNNDAPTPPAGTASGASVQQPDAPNQVGGTTDTATVASVAGPSSSTAATSSAQAPTVSTIEMPAAPQAMSSPETARASAQASSGTAQ